MLPGVRIKPVKLPIRKGTQEQFRLIEPTGMWRRIGHPQPGMRGEVAARRMADMRRAIVHDQVRSLCPRIAPGQLSDRPEEIS